MKLLDINTKSINDFMEFGEMLFDRYHSNYQSFEEVAQYLSNEIYNCIIQADGENVFALLRIFRFGTVDSLQPELQTQIPPDTTDIAYWLTLMGTYGDQPRWRNRSFSVGHQVFPAQAEFTPMLRETFNQMRLNPGEALSAEEAKIIFDRTLPYKRHFLIEDAYQSPHVPAQDDFVIPYRIQSVVGFGGSFINRSGFMCIGFTKIPISQTQLGKIIKLAPAISSILGFYEGRGTIWD